MLAVQLFQGKIYVLLRLIWVLITVIFFTVTVSGQRFLKISLTLFFKDIGGEQIAMQGCNEDGNPMQGGCWAAHTARISFLKSINNENSLFR